MPQPRLERRDIEVNAVFDIETEHWDSFVVGGIYYEDNQYEDYEFTSEDRMVDSILTIRGTVWAHAGGIFDFKWLLDHIAKRGLNAQIIAAGSRIVSVRVNLLRLCDSFALCPIKLADFSSGQGVAKETLNLPCVCGDDCGGYCSIARSMPREYMQRVRDYLYKDCKSLYDALSRLREYAAQNDLDLGMTIGGSAWRNARRAMGLPDSDMSTEEHTFCRKAYYGGRVQLYKPGLTASGHEYDVNSMYPWSLRTFSLPTGDRTYDYGASAQRKFSQERDGIYSGVIKVPDMHLPPLPTRYKNNTKTAYPVGAFEGTYTLPELRYALERGAEVNISQSITFESSNVIFRDWIDRLFALRQDAPHGGKKGPLGTFLKLYMNSLTGKFGSNPERDKFEINPEAIKVCNNGKECLKDGKADCGACCVFHCNGKCGAHYQLSAKVFYTKAFRIDSCAHIEWAAYLTSHARIALNRKQIEVDNGYDVIYSDTDSIYSVCPRAGQIGKELGEWDYGGECRDFYGIAPKCYYFAREDKIIKKAKGIRLPKKATSISAGTTYSDTSGIVGFKVGAREGTFFKRKDVTRLLSEQPGDRVKVAEGVTRAPYTWELPQ